MGRFGEEGYRDIKTFEGFYNELSTKLKMGGLSGDEIFMSLPMQQGYDYDMWIPRFLEGALNPNAPTVGVSREMMDFALDKLAGIELEVNRLVRQETLV